MGLKERLGKAMLQRIEAMPAVQSRIERENRLRPIENAARRVACRSLADDSAKTELSAGLQADAESLREATFELSRRRENYVDDRAYRLMSAAITDTPVQPIPPERAELFAREAELGRLPMQEAFQALARIEPALAELENQVMTVPQIPDAGGSCGLPEEANERLKWLVGGAATRDDELLRSDLANSIANTYLRRLAGDKHLGELTKSYFETPLKMVVVSQTFGRRPRPPAS